jgi:hypothetical protein
MPVRDGPSCPGCGLPNYEGMCPVCRGDERATRDEGLPYPWDAPETDDGREWGAELVDADYEYEATL